MNEYILKVVVEHVKNQYDALTKLMRWIVLELKQKSIKLTSSAGAISIAIVSRSSKAENAL